MGKSPTFTVKCSVAHNGLSITTFDALIDMGADAYILISQKFADKLTKHLKLDSKTDFPPGYVRPYKNIEPDIISQAMMAALRVQGYKFLD